jgi:hypothetical protein
MAGRKDGILQVLPMRKGYAVPGSENTWKNHKSSAVRPVLCLSIPRYSITIKPVVSDKACFHPGKDKSLIIDLTLFLLRC